VHFSFYYKPYLGLVVKKSCHMSHLDEIFNEPNYLNRSMSHVDAILNETNNLNRSMSHVDAIFNDPISTCNTDEISVPIQNHKKRPLDDDRTIRPLKRDEIGKQIVGSDGRIKCTMCGGRYYERGIKAHSMSCLKKWTKITFTLNQLKYNELRFILYSIFYLQFLKGIYLLITFFLYACAHT